jgi:hypothetical protein
MATKAATSQAQGIEAEFAKRSNAERSKLERKARPRAAGVRPKKLDADNIPPISELPQENDYYFLSANMTVFFTVLFQSC